MACHIAPFLVLCMFALGALAVPWDRTAVQVVANGTHFVHDASGVTYKQPDGSVGFEKAPEGVAHSRKDTGWIASVWTFNSAYTYFSAVWRVPPVPANPNGQILFFFNSFENSQYNDILQPVLQYNNGVAGWTLASWYGANGNYFESTPVSVGVNDQITGVISLSGSTWSIIGYVNNVQRTLLTVSSGTVGTQTSGQFALEVYTVSQCAQYPPSNSLQATNMVLKNGNTQLNPGWSSSVNGNGCNAGASASGSTATISWNSGSASSTGCGAGLSYCPGNGQCYYPSQYVCSGTYPYLCPTSAPYFCNGGCASSC